MLKHFLFDKHSDKKHRLKIALQVKVRFSPIVMSEYFVSTQFWYAGDLRGFERISVRSLTFADSLTCFEVLYAYNFRTGATMYEIYENQIYRKYTFDLQNFSTDCQHGPLWVHSCSKIRLNPIQTRPFCARKTRGGGGTFYPPPPPLSKSLDPLLTVQSNKVFLKAFQKMSIWTPLWTLEVALVTKSGQRRLKNKFFYWIFSHINSRKVSSL